MTLQSTPREATPLQSTRITLPRAVALASTLLAIGGLASAAFAESPPPRRGPPPEAIEACADLDAGDACEVTHRGKTIEGTCAETPDGDLACRPAHPPEPPTPPKAAFEACTDAAAGDACSVTFDGKTIDGTCETLPSGLACRPDGPPPGE